MGRIFSAWEHESALIKTYLNKNISIVCEEVKLLTVGKGYKVSFRFMCKTICLILFSVVYIIYLLICAARKRKVAFSLALGYGVWIVDDTFAVRALCSSILALTTFLTTLYR